MRQAVGMAWKLADPVGYIDDDRIVALHSGGVPLGSEPDGVVG
jgi:hypothetical protein